MSKCDCKIETFIPIISEIDENCSGTWDMICSGNTLGCFQLESYLGQKLASECKPRNIQELAELISVMRPGCLEATLEDGNTVAYHYIKRKNGQEPIEYDVPELEPILKETYGLLLYQEQAMKIAQEIANFTMTRADTLRKSIGKKDVDLMAELATEFIEAATKNVGKTNAELIFSGIEKSQRYSFNKSHAVGYAENCYISAYAKYHYPKYFFKNYLNSVKDISEVAQLINNARKMKINVRPPDLRKKNANFEVIRGEIYYGLANIKGLSKSKLDPLLNSELPADWPTFLLHFSSKTDSTTIDGLIKSGAVDFFGKSRELMSYEYKMFRKLGNTKTVDFIQKNYKDQPLEEVLQSLLDLGTGQNTGLANVKSKEKVEGILRDLRNPSYSLKDTNTIVGKNEINLLGIPFSRTELDDCILEMSNMTCKDYQNGKNGVNGVIIVPINISNVKETKTKRGINPGQTMCFLSGFDEEAEINNIVVFSQVYDKYSHLLFTGNTVVLKGKRDRGSLQVQKVWQV